MLFLIIINLFLLLLLRRGVYLVIAVAYSF
jgi:hypothetical protein